MNQAKLRLGVVTLVAIAATNSAQGGTSEECRRTIESAKMKAELTAVDLRGGGAVVMTERYAWRRAGEDTRQRILAAAACLATGGRDERVRVEVRAGTGAVIDSGYVSGAEKSQGAHEATATQQPEPTGFADSQPTPTKMVP